jgi:plastocyanin
MILSTTPRGLLAAAVLLTASLMLGAFAAASGVALVSQKRRAFSVKSVQIAAGDTVRFTNEDTFVHQIYVEARALTFESDEQPPATSVEIRFPAAGDYEVRCHIHPKMLLNVNVR